MNKIDKIKHAIHEANLFRSKLSPEALAVPGFTSLKIRHLLNNLGAISTNYLDCGSHKGGSVCSTIFNNSLTHATCIDNFTEFTDGSPMHELLTNVGRFKPQDTQFKLISKNCWTVTPDDLPKEIDLYLYDCGHGREEQRDAVNFFTKSMADEFIFLVDDYSHWTHVKEGTKEGLDLADFRYKMKKPELLGFKVTFEQELWDGQPGNNFGYWNGFYVALCSKK